MLRILLAVGSQVGIVDHGRLEGAVNHVIDGVGGVARPADAAEEFVRRLIGRDTAAFQEQPAVLAAEVRQTNLASPEIIYALELAVGTNDQVSAKERLLVDGDEQWFELRELRLGPSELDAVENAQVN